MEQTLRIAGALLVERVHRRRAPQRTPPCRRNSRDGDRIGLVPAVAHIDAQPAVPDGRLQHAPPDAKLARIHRMWR